MNQGTPRRRSGIVYPNLRAEMARIGMARGLILERIRESGHPMSGGSLSAKLTGKRDFTFSEALAIKSAIGTDIPLEDLFRIG